MKKVIAFFASRRYWENEIELDAAYSSLSSSFEKQGLNTLLITEEIDLKQLPDGDTLVIVPMSGAVQRLVLSASTKYKAVIMYAMYIIGNAEKKISEKMLINNAAPTVMDSWAVIRREHSHGVIALNNIELERHLKVFEAYFTMQGAKVILIGETEPWVISNSKELSTYSRLGVNVKKVSQQEVADLYNSLTNEDAKEYYKYFKGDEKKIVEPTDDDIWDSCRMAAALVKTVKKYEADAMALACFNLLKEGTNCCLGVSYLIDCLGSVAACEGDVDSAVTMLAMSKMTDKKVWMANPGLHPDGIINFSHCTAPINALGDGKCPYVLRNHHESGIGVSLQVEYPINQVVTACRISDEASKMTVRTGKTIEGKYEHTCRTQAYIKLDGFKEYLETALGCHQVFVFDDISEEMTLLAKQLDVELL